MHRCLLLAAFALATCNGCRKTATTPHKAEAPAKVEKLPQETEIARITLTEHAEQRLGITLANVVQERVPRRRTFGGEVTIPAGKSIVVSAPVAGEIVSPAQSPLPLPGQRVHAGDLVLTLAPLLSPERYVPTPAERIQMANARATLMSALTVARGDVQRSRAEVESAEIAMRRAEQLLSDRAGSAKAVDDARAILNVAQPGLQAAEERQRQFEKLLSDLDANTTGGTAVPLPMTSPQSGVIRSLSVTPGQTVNMGTALFEVVDVSSMWIRVPVYVGLLPDVQLQAGAQIVGLDGRPLAAPRQARPVVAPPTADLLSNTADLYFEVENVDGRLRPAQRVGVELSLQGEQDELLVSAKSILYDIFGGTWVYLKTGEHAFERRRVLVRSTEGHRAVLAEGPPPGTAVVVDGAAELYGTEFGAGK